MKMWVVIFIALAGLAGCQADPSGWRGGQKYLNVHAVAFTPHGKGLIMVGPRRSGGSQANATAYYYLHLPTMVGRRLGYGQYSLGQALVCPFENWVAIPAYMPSPRDGADGAGYELYDLMEGRSLNRASVDNPDLFVPHAGEQAPTAELPASQPDSASLVAVWKRVSPRPLTPRDQEQVRTFRPRWLTREARKSGVKVENVDGQAMYVLDSPDRRHKLYLRFHAPSKDAAGASDPDGEGYAYGFLQDKQTSKRYMLYTTTGADERLDSIGSTVFGGPIWLVQQPIKWFHGQ